jgi:putative ABC transport system permease protein
MWKLWPLLLATLGRHRLRLAFTVGSISVAFLLYGLLSAVNHALTGGVELAGQDRLITTHKTSIIQSLPRAYLDRVRGYGEVRGAASLSWFGGYYQDARQQLPVFVVDENYFELYPEIRLVRSEFEDWQGDRAAAMVGAGTAAQFGWRVGDVVPLKSNIFVRRDGRAEWPVRIAGIYRRDEGPQNAILLHYDYLNEARTFGKDTIGWIIIRVRHVQSAPELARQIDAQFENSPEETRTASEKAVAQSFANQLGDIGAIIRFVVSAVFFAMLLVTANTMAQSVRERTPEFAVLKTLGFTDATVLGFVLLESVLVALLGGCLGLALAVLIAGALQPVLSQFLPSFRLTATALYTGLGFMVALGVLAGLWPAWSAMRLRIVVALRRG